ncbi:hypothetical protein RF656_20005 [Yersinia kristensenii]|uniref:hypothetical protein n=1 Tax=Yersinia TaxID=629 RepID=UPI0028533EDF|nr:MULTISPECIES: hypothetical protein [Yersinia]MDR4899005.1 hypothetical protein [Yersinia kristensenii]MDR5020476.1 hypothetical protein [Yersinia rochesterensis]
MMNIEKMLRRKDDLNKRIGKVTRVIEEAGKGQTLSIYEYNRTEIRIDFPDEVLVPLLEKELVRLNEKLQIILDAEQTAERVIAGLLTNQ